jgi:UDP-GlcNAc:undecaprenyl-phosphate GlcNAc-1-phosphate transferase
VDGLAAGIGLFASAKTLLAALMQHNFGRAAAARPPVDGVVGFLPYNFNPATVFLSDSGSLLIGFLLGCYGGALEPKSATIIGMTAPADGTSDPPARHAGHLRAPVPAQ